MLERLFDIWKVLKINRWPVMMTAIVLLFLTVIPNGQDLVLRILSRPDKIHHGAWAWWWFLCSLVIYSLTGWYWSRQILSFQFHDWPPYLRVGEDPTRYQARMERILWWHEQLPRWTGIAAIGLIALVVSVLLFVARIEQAWKFLLLLWGLTAVVGLFIYYRRQLFRFRLQRPPFKAYESVAELPHSTRWILASSLIVLSGMMFVVVVVWHATIAPSLGSVTTLLCAAAAWIPVGCLLMYFGNHYRVPIFTLLFVWVLAISVLNDNHPVYTCSPRVPGCETPADKDARPTIETHLARWIADRPLKHGDRLPLVIVATEGGGIRAAYWTTAVLAQLSQHPQFVQHLFAISGVSGGSLGATVYAGLLAGQANVSLQCRGWEGIRECGRVILSNDFVAPTFAMLAYPDLVQRFLPYPFTIFDRGAVLEQGWSAAWQSVVKPDESSSQGSATGSERTNRFEQAFASLWGGEPSGWSTAIPSLFLNSTSVEHGVRVIKSSLRFNEKHVAGGHCVNGPKDYEPGDYGEFRNVIDLDDALACQLADSSKIPQIPLRSAVHNSARFMWISPAGRVSSQLHIVDGGYFENDGATTAGEILQTILHSEHAKLVDPIILHISNDQKDERLFPRRHLAEVMTPIWTLVKTRTGRATYADSWLKNSSCSRGVEQCHHYEIKIKQSDVPLPLGWTLSEVAIKAMDSELGNRTRQCTAELKATLADYLKCIERADVIKDTPRFPS